MVSLDPVYVYFEGDESTYLRYAANVRSGEQRSPRTAHTPVRVGLANEEGFPHEGYMDFVDNQLDTGTGTIRARAVVDNRDARLHPGPVRTREDAGQRCQADRCWSTTRRC